MSDPGQDLVGTPAYAVATLLVDIARIVFVALEIWKHVVGRVLRKICDVRFEPCASREGMGLRKQAKGVMFPGKASDQSVVRSAGERIESITGVARACFS